MCCTFRQRYLFCCARTSYDSEKHWELRQANLPIHTTQAKLIKANGGKPSGDDEDADFTHEVRATRRCTRSCALSSSQTHAHTCSHTPTHACVFARLSQLLLEHSQDIMGEQQGQLEALGRRQVRLTTYAQGKESYTAVPKSYLLSAPTPGSGASPHGQAGRA